MGSLSERQLITDDHWSVAISDFPTTCKTEIRIPLFEGRSHPSYPRLCGSHKFFTGHRGCVFVDCPKCESAGKSLARRRSVEFKAPSTASRSCRGRDCRGECVNCWTGARRKES